MQSLTMFFYQCNMVMSTGTCHVTTVSHYPDQAHMYVEVYVLLPEQNMYMLKSIADLASIFMYTIGN